MMPSLHIEMDPSAGFCFGVDAAVRKAESALKTSGTLFCVGELLHNAQEVNRLKRMGLRCVSRSELPKITGGQVLFRAHGEPSESYELVKRLALPLVDATCPVVHKLQQRVREACLRGEFVIIFGKKGHPEVEGLVSQCNQEALVVEYVDEVAPGHLPARLALFSQTTMPEDRFHQLAAHLRKLGKEVIVHDTTCRQVSGRVAQMASFAARMDVVVFVGGESSSNARQLFGVCSGANPRSYFISEPKNLLPGWFRTGDHVGVSGGTSTPPWLLEEVRDALEIIGAQL